MLEPALLDDAGFDEGQRELLRVTATLLEAIRTGDEATYSSLCAPELSCFEDVCPYRVDGVEFHLHLLRYAASHPERQPVRQDILTPRVQVYGETGIVTYTRLCTYEDSTGLRWTTYNETRVFVRMDGVWRMVHFHRSPTVPAHVESPSSRGAQADR